MTKSVISNKKRQAEIFGTFPRRDFAYLLRSVCPFSGFPATVRNCVSTVSPLAGKLSCIVVQLGEVLLELFSSNKEASALAIFFCLKMLCIVF